jgi:hypothetical protein
MTTGVFVKFGALRERFYEERMWLQVLKMLSEERVHSGSYAVRGEGYERHMFCTLTYGTIMHGKMAFDEDIYARFRNALQTLENHSQRMSLLKSPRSSSLSWEF